MPIVFVHEDKSFWTADLQRHFYDRDDFTIRWEPHFPALVQRIRQAPALILIVSDISLEKIHVLHALSPGSPLVQLSQVDAAITEWSAREIGVSVVLPVTTEKHRVAESLLRLAEHTFTTGTDTT